jgi:dihydroneopterin aldolase
MQLIFKGGSETVTLDIDRKNKLLDVTSSKTNYKRVSAKWKDLFDKGKEKLQERITDKLSDEMFITAISINMNKVGYTLFYKKC